MLYPSAGDDFFPDKNLPANKLKFNASILNLMRSLASVIAGYLSHLFLTIFPRVVFSLYSRSELRIHTYRLSDTPLQDYMLIGMEPLAAVLAALITVSICRKKAGWHLLALAILMIPEALYMLSLPGPDDTPLFIVASLLLRGSGLLLGYFIYRKFLVRL